MARAVISLSGPLLLDMLSGRSIRGEIVDARMVSSPGFGAVVELTVEGDVPEGPCTMLVEHVTGIGGAAINVFAGLRQR